MKILKNTGRINIVPLTRYTVFVFKYLNIIYIEKMKDHQRIVKECCFTGQIPVD